MHEQPGDHAVGCAARAVAGASAGEMGGPRDADGAGGAWDSTGGPDSWHSWRRGLPVLIAQILQQWDLRPDGYRNTGECSLVLGVHTRSGEPAAVKFGWPHPESEHEHLALRLWGGSGAVRLLRADPGRSVLLEERAGPTDLTAVPLPRACAVVAGLYGRLHRPATPQFRHLSDLCRRWSHELAALPADAPAPNRLVRQATTLSADFAVDTATDGTLLHGDLHYANVLTSRREPWLAIDPKPLSGDPCFEVAPLLWNRWDEAVATGDARRAVRERMFLVTDLAGFDPDRVRDWVIVREMVNVLWALQESPSPGPAEREWITRSVAIAKAVQG